MSVIITAKTAYFSVGRSPVLEAALRKYTTTGATRLARAADCAGFLPVLAGRGAGRVPVAGLLSPESRFRQRVQKVAL
jgi:hypothetical protein